MKGLYAITDGSTGDVLLGKVGQALRGGAALVQYRDKTDDTARREQEARALRALCHAYGALFIVNDDVELARNVNADGVHIGRHDAQLRAVRERLGAHAIIGVSCYNQLELALQAQGQGASYVAFGSFFPSLTKPDAPRATLETLRAAKRQLRVPVCAIGGITLDNAAQLTENGADMLAVITDVFSADDIQAAAQQFSRHF